MDSIPLSLRKIKRNKSFILFLLIQGISSIGDTFQFIAITILLLKITGSGLSVGFSMICTCVPGFILAAFAGGIGDRFREKYIIFLLFLIKGAAALLFMISREPMVIYTLMLAVSSLDILCGPARKKIIIRMLKGKEEVMIGNSLLYGISGISYMIGMPLAGVLVNHLGVDTAFAINSITLALSASLIPFLKTERSNTAKVSSRGKSLLKEIQNGFDHYRSSSFIRELVNICLIVSFCATSINIAFYSFAFDSLEVTSKGWGIMMSIYYGTNLIAMFIPIIFSRVIGKNIMKFIYLALISTSIAWFFYGLTQNLMTTLALQFIEGTSMAVYGILLGTLLQVVPQKNFVARISGINDMMCNVIKMISICFTFIISNFYFSNAIFIINAVLLFVCCLYKLIFHDTH